MPFKRTPVFHCESTHIITGANDVPFDPKNWAIVDASTMPCKPAPIFPGESTPIIVGVNCAPIDPKDGKCVSLML